ncbi:MAG: T9SS type A sorting domain-containing protein [Bacteroidota bacterium]|nr:T9SS type A sorting domain-containing protein [Bacteroidota bacterium]
MGDYFDMVSNNTGVHLAWVNTLNGEEDVYYSFITPSTLTGIDDVSGSINVTVYPNPTSGLLEISCDDKKIRIEIFTTVGQKVFSTSVYNTSHVIDISSQSAGIYFLKLISDDHQETIKKIIRK